MKKIKKLLVFFSIIFVFAFGFSQSLSDVFSKLGISIKEYENNTPISRYDLVRLLNLAECFDCINPPQWAWEQFNANWWESFKHKPDSNFDDIFYRSTFYNKKDYYYCIAYAASKGYIHGFPRNISPVCPGKFCGANYASYADLIQIITNILADKIYNQYYVNWKQILDWYNKLPESSILKKVFNQQDIENIQKGVRKCGDSRCVLENSSEFNTYLKYCTFNLEKCGFKSFENLSEGSRPVAQVNVLLQNGILTEQDIKKIKSFSKPVPKKLVLDILARVKNLIKCEYDFDYDNDGILNKDDNCMYIYNPSQRDLDQDGIGNVCDDDIDGDGVKNPVGVVDDKDNIILSKLLDGKKRDNCILIYNPDQKDSNNNGIGDVCENQSNIFALQITANPLGGQAPANINFVAQAIGKLKQVRWHYGDGIQGIGIKTSHYYKNPGVYNVLAYGRFSDGSEKSASLTIKLDKQNISSALQIFCEPLVGQKPLKVVCKSQAKGDIVKVRWFFAEKDKKEALPNQAVSKIYFQKGVYTIIAQGINKKGNIVASAQLNIGVNDQYVKDNVGAYFTAYPLQAKIGDKIKFNTKIRGFKHSDIKNIFWDFGDGVRVENKDLLMYHLYEKPGSYIVRQSIVLLDGRRISNHLTISIKDNKQKYGKGIFLQTDKLVAKVGEKVNYKIVLSNINLDEITKIDWYFEDIGQNLSYKPEETSLKNSHIFYKPGSFKVKAVVYTKDGNKYEASLIQGIKGLDICSPVEYKKLHCDMDQDGIPDVCDDDIDGDGIPNLLGLLVRENKDCKITSDIVNQAVLEEQRQVILKNYNKGENPQFDNCPFVANPDQADEDTDGKGDVCDENQKIWTVNKYGFVITNLWTSLIDKNQISEDKNKNKSKSISTVYIIGR